MTLTTEAHVISIPGLNVPKLTKEQAIIVMGATGRPTVDEAIFKADLNHRAADLANFSNMHLDQLLHTVPVRMLYCDDFSRMVGIKTDDNDLHHTIMDLLRDAIMGPLAIWDNRIDVFLDGHIPQDLEPKLVEECNKHFNVTVEFTKRPGVTKQTWITMHRNVHKGYTTQKAMAWLTFHTLHMLQDAINANPDTEAVKVTMPFHLPDEHHMTMTQFLNQSNLMVDPHTGVGITHLSVGSGEREFYVWANLAHRVG